MKTQKKVYSQTVKMNQKMKKIILSFVALIALAPATVFANEGMWFLMHIQRLNQRDMQKMGLQLTAEEIYSVNNSSLKDAIVQFNGGCTAEMISKDGLVLTNHHCGYDAIAELSSPESNYLRDGFWAQNRKAELKPKSLFVRFFVRMDDVSKRILSLVNDKMTEAEREAARLRGQGVALFRQEVAKGMTEAAEQMKQANLDTNVILFSMWTEAVKNFAEYGKGNIIFLDGSASGMENTMKQIQALMVKQAGV